MFQGILLKTDPGLISSVGVWIVFAATMFFENMRKILLFIVALSFLFFAFRSQAAIGGPGVCGTSCMASMNGYYRMPGLFYWPTYPNPWMTSPWTMMGSPYS